MPHTSSQNRQDSSTVVALSCMDSRVSRCILRPTSRDGRMKKDVRIQNRSIAEQVLATLPADSDDLVEGVPLNDTPNPPTDSLPK